MNRPVDAHRPRPSRAITDRALPAALVPTGAFLALLCLTVASATTFHVEPDGSGDFATIQEAIDASSHGDLILLGDGTFRGDGNRDLQYWGRAITIQAESEDPELCIIDCQGSAAEPHRAVRFCFGEPPGAQLVGITIRNGYQRSGPFPRGGAIEICHASPTLVDCVFLENQATYGGAIYCEDHASPEIRACRFLGNMAQQSAGGIDLYDQCMPLLADCLFWGNMSAGYGSAISVVWATIWVERCTVVGNIGFDSPAIGIWTGSGLLMERSIVAFNERGTGILCEDGYAHLSCCDVYGNDHGDWVSCIAGQYGTDGNIAADPLFCDPQAGDFTLAANSPCYPHQPHATPETCLRIGAFDSGCERGGAAPIAMGPTPPRRTTWGALKASFRN